jgi:hypothetical protein
MRSCALLMLVAACSSPSGPAPITSHSETHLEPVVDSHVHLAYYPVGDELALNGIRAVVDLGSPERTLTTTYPIRVLRSGPMLTRLNGYPLNSWGADGYGVGCETSDCIDRTIDRLASEGIGVVKIALDDQGLPLVLAAHATLIAHRRGLKVVVHALSEHSARFAAGFGADVLSHTPLEPLSDETISLWSREKGRAVITTLAAFGGSPVAIDNLRKLRAAGVTVLYGTDLGNLRVDGPSTLEMELMKSAGMTDDEVRASMTTVPWHFWGFDAIQAQ